MSRQLFLFASVAFLAAATWLIGGARPGEIGSLFRAEAHADITSLKEDVRLLSGESGLLRADLMSLWVDARSDAIMLQADARVEAERLARPLSVNPQY